MAYNQAYQPEHDAGLGLVFRLNALWDKADRIALTGEYDEWELVLDRIFSNLMYRGEPTVERNGGKEITSIEFREEKMNEWKFIKQEISKAKALRNNKTRNNYKLLQSEHYLRIVDYDIFLRKFMQFLKLYLKESESNPSKALFGGAFGKR